MFRLAKTVVIDWQYSTRIAWLAFFGIFTFSCSKNPNSNNSNSQGINPLIAVDTSEPVIKNPAPVVAPSADAKVETPAVPPVSSPILPKTCQSFAQTSDGSTPSLIPKLLSDTGCLPPNKNQLAASTLIPYEIVAPLWSDKADKQRFIALPEKKTLLLDGEGRLTLPVGGVLIKSFSLQGKLVETRLLIRSSEVKWSGYSYEWNEDGSDAVLLEQGKDKLIGEQTWTFPSRDNCLTCHNKAAGMALGLDLQQLSRMVVPAGAQQAVQQVEYFKNRGIVPMNTPILTGDQQLLIDPSDNTQTIAARARSYLHSNCSNCHQVGAPAYTSFDFRISKSLSALGICNLTASSTDIGGTD
ncbi:MAG: hypothetical protein NTX25_01180, partial [Proteobacteria bacterium]|nr:hypothetical protein [Pseudomonadota bacterium]